MPAGFAPSRVPASAASYQADHFQVSAGGGSSISLKVPWYSQFQVGRGFKPGNTACLKASAAMASGAGATDRGNEERLQLAQREDRLGRITVDPARAREGQAYIDGELSAGKPVIVGVSHQGTKKYNVDGITDHFVVITGRSEDLQGRTFYTFNDPATRYPEIGRDTNPNNRFRVDPETGKLFRPGSDATGVDTGRRYEVSMIRRNTGQ